MKTSALLAYILLYICLTEASAADVPPVSSFHAEPLSYERLPDMHVPRFGHAAFYAGGELVVAGGHTSGFVPTATTERLSGGPDMKIATVATESGFANEASFFRTFKAVTGMTPREWVAANVG